MMAKDLIRTRHQVEKFYKLKSQLQGVALRIQVIFDISLYGIVFFCNPVWRISFRYLELKILLILLHLCLWDLILSIM